MNAKKSQGFTLVEVIIVVAIIAILASVSMGFYGGYVIKANRTDARSTLTATAASLEKCKAVYGSYKKNCNVSFPITSEEELYSVTAPTLEDSEFELKATPVAGKTQANDKHCKTMTLTNTGLKEGSGDTPIECW